MPSGKSALSARRDWPGFANADQRRRAVRAALRQSRRATPTHGARRHEVSAERVAAEGVTLGFFFADLKGGCDARACVLNGVQLKADLAPRVRRSVVGGPERKVSAPVNPSVGHSAPLDVSHVAGIHNQV